MAERINKAREQISKCQALMLLADSEMVARLQRTIDGLNADIKKYKRWEKQGI